MCILFMYVSNHTGKCHVSSSPYKLILASNRDEKLSRPTKPAGFWESSGDSHILAGQDLEELGTWLGISKNGKLAMLLNIMSANSTLKSEESVSRGSLVTGFLRSPPCLPGCTYLKNLCHLDILGKYKTFHLITVDVLGCKLEANTTPETVGKATCQRHLAKDVSPELTACPASIDVTYLTNQNQKSESGEKYSDSSYPTFPEPQQMTPPANTCQTYAFGNSVIDKPFKKVECGRVEFERLVGRHCETYKNTKDDGDSLVEELLQFLKSTETHFPDEILEEQIKGTKIPKELLPRFSSRFINLPGVDYGTRTHTIVLVDVDNNVTFHEWTMQQPGNLSSAQWSHSKYAFTLTSLSSQ